MINKKIKNYDKYMLLATMPLMFCGFVLYGVRVILLCLSAVVTAKAMDVMVSMLRRSEFDAKDNSSAVAAMIFCLLMPANIPFYVVNITVALVILIGKHAFGGKGVYPFNLAALATCVAAVNWPDKVFSAVIPFSQISLLSGETTGVVLSNAEIIKEGGVPVYKIFDMLLGNFPGVIGADFLLVILVIGGFMIYKKMITWHAPVTFVVTTALIAFLFPRIYGFSRIASVKMEILNSAVIYCSLFMLNEPTTTPKSDRGKIAFGFLVAVLAMVFSYYGNVPIGTSFAVLLVNAIEGFIDRAVNIKDINEIKELLKRKFDEKKTKIKSAIKTMELISEVEDDIDDVIYSTRTIDRQEVLKLEREKIEQKKAEDTINEK